jgi:signal transduction histidine kinase/ActR/RegA family two-component response regulator
MKIRAWSGLSVRTKLTAITMAVSVTALALGAVGVIAYEHVAARRELVSQVESIADVIGASSTAAVQFGDPLAAAQALAALRADGDIEAARIDLPDGGTLARYGDVLDAIPSGLPLEAAVELDEAVAISRPIRLDGQVIAALRMQASLRRVNARIVRYQIILVVMALVASVVAYLLSSVLQRAISGPIMRLAHAASEVSLSRDYGVRAVKEHDDELGVLVDRFNDMLQHIERRDLALRDARDQLEARVADRTRTLELEIAERRRTEQELIVAKAAAEEASIAKSAFLANMSHELRTPLNAIIGYSELLQEEAELTGASACVPDIGRIRTAGRHLLALINDVLDLSKIEAGRMELDLSTFDPVDVVRATVSTVDALASARGNTIRVAPIPALGSMHSDRTKLEQVLLNVVGNAVKFTQNGNIDIVASRDAAGDRDWLVVRIADTGIGMTPEQASRLFQEFTQADVSTTRRYGGSGLGLAISRRLGGLMGGDIAVESEANRGSLFTVRLPMHVTGPASTHSSSPLPESDMIKNTSTVPTVLVVEDDAGARDLVGRALRKVGWRVVEATSAEECLDILGAHRVDAVLVDVILPGRDGWSLLDEIKRTPNLAALPVVVVSVHDDQSRSLALGAVAHLRKPMRADDLVAVLRRCWREESPVSA